MPKKSRSFLAVSVLVLYFHKVYCKICSCRIY
uniref:GUANINE NUCLEOTIDE EXCHANGE FACTOR MSS4 exchange factor, Rab GTPase.65A n=1 Tax=Siphoviridae sp. ctwQg18 TaxID=2826516 RepID=A0A8S5MJF6_9CAUD|nr:MAG TPA: GUANINE NUCLEOTIDE EXCHANGE FACTOR MSS4 exchange factor, Rab GTPase.65A [Siphoviridae sp. ctwQg18]DAD82194.1 MAG TPA: GUANINE NUCLEOTIDE EXCHANGE FACTOR MSS4 exchange factor, Rab GTPase.65A [Siphoviridae sp. ctwQg18]